MATPAPPTTGGRTDDNPFPVSCVGGGKIAAVRVVADGMRGLAARGRRTSRLLSLDAALEALGHDGDMGSRCDEVPVADIVGTAARSADFDAEFRLVNPALRDRWQRVADTVRPDGAVPAVRLVQLGEVYFVVDGHHRVSVARHRGQLVIPAEVRRVCTVAYAMCCIRAEHLATKAAERSFLERVPLPDDVRPDLWLDRPADWLRLADAAEAWGLRRTLAAPDGQLDRHGLAAAWWRHEVQPMLHRLRAHGVGLDLRDIQLYVAALAARDELGTSHWPEDLAARLEPGRRRG